MFAFRLPRCRHIVGAIIVLIGVVFAFFTADPRTPDLVIKPTAHFISSPVHTGFLVLGIGSLLFIAWWKKNRALAIRTVAVIGTETALYGVTKAVTWYGMHQWSRPSGSDGGFPSGHTAATVALAWILSEQFGPKWSPLFYAIASAVAWSRVADGAHYGYQVAAGAVLGYVVAWTLSGRFVAAEPSTSASTANEEITKAPQAQSR